jgi:renalase
LPGAIENQCSVADLTGSTSLVDRISLKIGTDMPGDAPKKRVAIVGAGIAGVACAHALQERGFTPIIFEKSRGLGGRLATRRADDGLTIDHGAQFLTARTPAFRTVVQHAQSSGTVGRWSPIVCDGERGADEEWFVGVPAMNAFLKPMIAGVKMHLGCEVRAIMRDGAGWRIICADPVFDETFTHVVCAAPAPQAHKLLAHDRPFDERLLDVSIAPCWALLFGVNGRLPVEGDLWRSDDLDLRWLTRNASKPERNGAIEGWVAHASPTWSIRHLEQTADDVRGLLLSLVEERLGTTLPSLTYAKAHRWRYALTTVPLGAPYMCSDDRTLFLGGDWCLGARVEYAYQSGAEIAAALIEAST